jgi:hypothetical protein
MDNSSEPKTPTSSAKRKVVPHNEEDRLQDALLQPSNKSIKMTINSANKNSEEKVSIGALPQVTPTKPPKSAMTQDSNGTSTGRDSINNTIYMTPSSKLEPSPMKQSNADLIMRSPTFGISEEFKGQDLEQSKSKNQVSDIDRVVTKEPPKSPLRSESQNAITVPKTNRKVSTSSRAQEDQSESDQASPNRKSTNTQESKETPKSPLRTESQKAATTSQKADKKDSVSLNGQEDQPNPDATSEVKDENKVSEGTIKEPRGVKKKVLGIKKKVAVEPSVESTEAPKRGRKPAETKAPNNNKKSSKSPRSNTPKKKTETGTDDKLLQGGANVVDGVRKSTRNKSKQLPKATIRAELEKKEEKKDEVNLSNASNDEDEDISQGPNNKKITKKRGNSRKTGNNKKAISKDQNKKEVKPKATNENVLQIKITLDYITPKIWRRIEVPETYTFAQLSRAILDAMGWGGGHMHQFTIPGIDRIMIGHLLGDGLDIDGTRDEKTVKVSEFLKKEHDFCIYEYDFGDGWTHLVEVEKKNAKESGVEYPRCLDGKRACPPDDCGGSDGYKDLLKILKNRSHPEHEEMKEWTEGVVGGEFRPEHFDPAEVMFAENLPRGLGWFLGVGSDSSEEML